MQKYLLKEVYKDLLNEAILDQSTFLEKLVKIAEKKPAVEGKYGKLIKIIVSAMKKTKLISLRGDQSHLEDLSKKSDISPEERALLKKRKKDNKKQRKQAEVTIHKSLKEIKGLDGEPIDLKKMRPLYDSLISYLENKSLVSIDDCIMSADFYMKDFYANADLEEKKIIDTGKFDFSLIFKRTNFYQRFLDFKVRLTGISTELIQIYEDDNIKIVYPTTPDMFNTVIREESGFVDWCTQSPTTWYSYSRTQYLMILRNKNELGVSESTYIISLKVNHDGTVDYNGTCDANNKHMNKASIQEVLGSSNVEDIIFKKTNSPAFKSSRNEMDPNDEEYKDYIDTLLDVNNFKSITNMLVLYSTLVSEESFGEVANFIFDASIKKNKLDDIVDVYCDVISSIHFEREEGLQNTNIDWKLPLIIHDLFEKVTERLFQKTLEPRNHEKYLIALLDLLGDKLQFILGAEVDKLKDSAMNAFNTNNFINFKKVILAISRNQAAEAIVLDSKDSHEILTTKGFKKFFEEKKGNIITADDYDLNYNFHSTSAEIILTRIILNNKDYFAKYLQSNEGKEKSSSTHEDVDIKTIVSYMENKIEKNSHDINSLKKGLDALSPYLLSSNISDANAILDNVLYDADLLNTLYQKSSVITNIAFRMLMTNLNKDSGINYNAKSSEVFEFCISVMSVDSIIETLRKIVRNPYMQFLSLINICISFNKNLNSTNEKIVAVLSRLMLSYTHIHEEIIISLSKDDTDKKQHYYTTKDTIDFYLDLVIEWGNYLSFARSVKEGIVTNNFLNIGKRNTASPKLHYFIESLIKIPTLKSILLSPQKRVPTSQIEPSLNIGDIYCILYIDTISRLSNENIIETLKSYVNIIMSGDPSMSQPTLILQLAKEINRALVKRVIPDNRLSIIVGRAIHSTLFFGQDSFFYRDLVLQMIKRFNDLKTSFEKKLLAKIVWSGWFAHLREIERNLILINFISIGSDNVENRLSAKDRAIVRDCLINGTRKNKKHLLQDKEIILALTRKLDRISKRHMYLAFPSEKDLNEMLIREYLKELLTYN